MRFGSHRNIKTKSKSRRKTVKKLEYKIKKTTAKKNKLKINSAT